MDVQILFEIPDPWESYGYVIEMIINRNWGKTFDYVSFLDFQVLMDGQSLRAKCWNVHEDEGHKFCKTS